MKPGIVLIHGAWHVPGHYDLLAQQLRARGFEVDVPHLPTSTELTAQMSFEHDVRFVQDFISTRVDQGRHIIVISHSYGGSVVTEALEDFALSTRKTKRLPGGVIHLVYMSAFMLQPGQNGRAANTRKDGSESAIERYPDGTSFPRVSPRAVFWPDIDDSLAKRCEKMLVRHCYAANTTPLTKSAWRYIPVTYIEGTEDKVIPIDGQRMYVQAVREAGVHVAVETLHSSHSPFLSRPKEVASIVETVARAY